MGFESQNKAQNKRFIFRLFQCILMAHSKGSVVCWLLPELSLKVSVCLSQIKTYDVATQFKTKLIKKFIYKNSSILQYIYINYIYYIQTSVRDANILLITTQANVKSTAPTINIYIKVSSKEILIEGTYQFVVQFFFNFRIQFEISKYINSKIQP